ncbi:MAG: YbjN domain-containing protein [Rhodobacterales bacterium]|nr:YbjN domain-containing protein [Rhodobacterales bacterium]MDX5414399.1 YbjN domain-containing protein [Rhodobacterales bacterium]
MVPARFSVPVVLSLMTGLALSGPVLAQSATDLLDGSDPDAILSIAQGYGSAMLDVDSVGDPMIEGRIGGQAYTVFFYGCENGAGCS